MNIICIPSDVRNWRKFKSDSEIDIIKGIPNKINPRLLFPNPNKIGIYNWLAIPMTIFPVKIFVFI